MSVTQLFRAALGALALIVALAATPANAGLLSFVSATGVDTGNCDTPAAACRTFAFARDKTIVGGEIRALTPGEYGPIVINKKLTLIGVEGAGIAIGAGGTAIAVSAATADEVHVIGLSLDGLNGAGLIGVKVNAAGKLSIKNCKIRNFGERGIFIEPTSAVKFAIEDTILTNIGGGVGGEGIRVAPLGGGSAEGMVNRVDSSNNQFGILVTKGAKATLSDSVFSSNSITGVQAGESGAPTTLGEILITRLMVTGNQAIGVRVLAGSTGQTAGTNYVRNNATNTSGNFTNVGTQ